MLSCVSRCIWESVAAPGCQPETRPRSASIRARYPPMHSEKVASFLLQSFVAAGFEGPGLIVAEAPMESASQTALCRFPV